MLLSPEPRDHAGDQRRPGAPYAVTGFACTALLHPGLEALVQRRRPDDRRVVERQGRRVEHEGAGLRPAQSAVAADQLLEGGDLLGLGVVQAHHQDVRGVREPVRAPQVGGGIRPERGQRVLAHGVAVVQVVQATGSEHQPAVPLGVDHDEADPRVVGQPGQQAGIVLGQLLEREPTGPAGEGD